MSPWTLDRVDRVAVVTGNGARLSYRDLIHRADVFVRQLPASRRTLVALFGDRDLGTVLAYVAAMRHGHAVAWFGAARRPEQQTELLLRFKPEVVVAPRTMGPLLSADPAYQLLDPDLGGDHDLSIAERVTGEAAELDDETGVLLLTSGTTGLGRAVRLPTSAIRANSMAIADTLDIHPDRRAATALPLHYSYGLSVLNSHLAAGASVLLTAVPATTSRFWRAFAEAGCTTFPAVPFQLDWLSRSIIPWDRVPGLGSVTVSGSRISEPLAALTFARLDAAGVRFHKMYGQTEATARISVLAHEDFPHHATSVGQVIGESVVTIENDRGQVLPDGSVGRIIYHGPHAMRGYARDAADLVAPDQCRGTVDTRDEGFVADGFLHVSGRLGRFVKPQGRRVELDVLETHFEHVGPVAAVGTDDEKAHVFVEGVSEAHTAGIKKKVASLLEISPGDLRVHVIPELPRMANGKVDYRGLTDLADRTTGPSAADLQTSAARAGRMSQRESRNR